MNEPHLSSLAFLPRTYRLGRKHCISSMRFSRLFPFFFGNDLKMNVSSQTPFQHRDNKTYIHYAQSMWLSGKRTCQSVARIVCSVETKAKWLCWEILRIDCWNLFRQVVYLQKKKRRIKMERIHIVMFNRDENNINKNIFVVSFWLFARLVSLPASLPDRTGFPRWTPSTI